MSTPTVNVTLNSFDAEGNQVDTDNMDLAHHQVSDIVDHAAQLVVVMRDLAAKRSGIEAFDQVFAELEASLQSAGVVSEDKNPMPVLLLKDGGQAIKCDDAEHATILAALRFYQRAGMGEPDNRSDEIHDIATNCGAVTSSLDEDGINELCERIN